MAKIVKLTVPDALFERIRKEKQMFGYGTIQEVVNEVLRNKFFRTNIKRKNRVGRPRKMDETKLITRHGKIFSKKGVPIEV